MDAARCYVANTDYDWYRYLLERSLAPEPPDEVNFWRPSGSKDFHAVRPGAPFFFKLKAPHYAIAGFGYFARASRVPLSLAWEAFKEQNGAATFEEFRARLSRLRAAPLPRGEDPVIGCLMIAEPVFFRHEDWVRQPDHWPKNLQSGKTYSIAEGEGRRLLEECQERAGATIAAGRGHGLLGAEGGERYGTPALRRARLGQGTFSIAVRDVYGRACAVTREHSLPVLEAAHIKPYTEGGEHRLGNGLCLRSDVHKLFDKGYVTVGPDHAFRVSTHLRKDWNNGRVYYEYDGLEIKVPDAVDERPDPAMLEWHRETVFKG